MPGPAARVIVLGMEARRNRVRSCARTALVAACFALAGCGHTQEAGKGPTPNDVATTPRLLAWQLQASGTAPLEVGIFDSLRGVHCRFLLDSEGELRCLPLAPPALEVAPDFADAGCTERVYRALHLDDVASVVGRSVALPLPQSNCEARYVVGNLREFAAAEPHFAGIPGSCRQFTPIEREAGWHDFVVAQVTSPAAWVSGREVAGPLIDGRLRLRQFAAAGEASFAARLVDEQRDRSCSLDEVREQLVCVAPALSASSSYFVDAECRGAGLWRADACSEAVYIGRPDDLHGLGEAWPGAIFSQGKVCESLRDSEYAKGDSFFQQGEAVAVDALPAAEWTSDGRERLKLRGLKADDGSFLALSDELFDSSSQRRYPSELHQPRFEDAQIGAGCAPVWTRDAGVRCVPETTVVDPYTLYTYADAACTEPVYWCTSSTCPEELVRMAYDENGEYRAISRNRTVAVADVVYNRSADACVPGSATGGPPFFKAGDALPWDDFPELAELNGRASGAP